MIKITDVAKGIPLFNKDYYVNTRSIGGVSPATTPDPVRWQAWETMVLVSVIERLYVRYA